MKQFRKVIFIDSDDTCRAAMAKLIMAQKPLPYPLEIESRGLVVLFPEPLNAMAEVILKERGYDTADCMSTQLMQEDIGDDVLLLTMEDKQKTRVWEEYESAAHVYTFSEYTSYMGDVPPIHGEPFETYQRLYILMEQLTGELAMLLNEAAGCDTTDKEE